MLVAEVAIFFEGFVDDAFEVRREIGVDACWRSGLTVEDGVEDVSSAVAAEWKLAGGHFVEDGAEGEQIGAGVEFLGACLFGRHVRDSAESAARAGELIGIGAAVGGEGIADCGLGAGAGDFRQTEVENFGLAAGGDENVGGLDVAMDDTFRVGGVEARRRCRWRVRESIRDRVSGARSCALASRPRGTPWR